MAFRVQAGHSSLRCLTRLAQWKPKARAWLEQALLSRFPGIIDTAVDIAIETGDPIGRILADRLESCEDREILERVSVRCEEEKTLYSVPLQELAEVITRKLIDLGSPDSLSEVRQKVRLAELSMDLGNRLSAQGDHVEALSFTRQAVQLFRDLAAQEPEIYSADLALALHNLGEVFSELRQLQEAFEATQEAVEILRPLAARRPDLFQVDLTHSLDGLGIRLFQLDLPSESLKAMQEGIELQQTLPSAQLSDSHLASSRLNLGLVLQSMGRYQEALRWTQEAVDLYHELANDRPDAFTPQLARGLGNLGSIFAMLERGKEALSCTQQATVLFGKLATERPGSFIASYARNLSRFGLLTAEAEDVSDGLEFCEEAVRIFHELRKTQTDLFALDLARSLSNLAIARNFGDLDPCKTEQIFRRALRLLRRIGRKHPQTCHEDLTAVLHNLAVVLSRQGREETAARLAREGVALYRRLAAEDPALYSPYLAASLLRWCKRLEKLGRFGQARSACSECVDLYRGLSQQDPKAYGLVFAAALNLLQRLLQQTGRPEEARVAQKELAALRRSRWFRPPREL